MDDDCTLLDKMRTPRIYSISIFDWVLSFSIAFVIGNYLFRLRGVLQWITFLVLWVGFGILVHWYYGIDTMVAYYLGISNKPKIKHCKFLSSSFGKS